MKVLGIETSCDETAAAVVEDGSKLLSNVVASSVDLHAVYGGVVPEIAARSHLESILPVIEKALQDAFEAKSLELRAKGNKLSAKDSQLLAKFDPWDQIDAIAVTQGPGLLGSLLIGVLTARTLAIAKNKPLYAVNHVTAHVYAAFLADEKPEFPLLALIVSGGHTQLVLFKDHLNYNVLGQTTDDAVGEAFDKAAKILGLPYPGGPSIARVAKKGDPASVKLPIAKLSDPYSFSFSGLKTAFLRAAQTAVGKDYTFPSHEVAELLAEEQTANLAASFQKTAIDTLVSVLSAAAKEFIPANIVIAGGVAANTALRQAANTALSPAPIYPDIKLCTDNAAMIAALGYFQAKHSDLTADPYSLEADPGLKMS